MGDVCGLKEGGVEGGISSSTFFGRSPMLRRLYHAYESRWGRTQTTTRGGGESDLERGLVDSQRVFLETKGHNCREYHAIGESPDRMPKDAVGLP